MVPKTGDARKNKDVPPGMLSLRCLPASPWYWTIFTTKAMIWSLLSLEDKIRADWR